ncbi:MAG: glucose sorbosone dehydrogenase [Dehalococcoidia bacterium]|nr:glucose sorbosone dehydrogenase [Dehalococcoidia bacterium]
MTEMKIAVIALTLLLLAGACQQTAGTVSTPPSGAPTPSAGAKPSPAPPTDSGSPAPAAPAPASQATGPLPSLRAEQVFKRLPSNAITKPVFITSPPGDTAHVVILSQDGKAYLFNNDPNVNSAQVFIDLTSNISRDRGEEGLLGIAFHPQYQTNGYVYLYYSASGGARRTVLSRFTANAGRTALDPGSEVLLLEAPQPFPNHKGGMLTFGPDGYLYLGLGDGGSGGDPQGNGQNLRALLGKILRIDVNSQASGLKYGIPPDNPFANRAEARPEIYAYGMRNPWRFSFDRAIGQLWVGDVGQDAREEVDVVQKGGNYGWNIMEGKNCYQPKTGCNQQDLQLPVADYGHDLGCSVTGGYVYRGKEMPALVGAYLYSDFCSGRVWALRYQNGQVTEQAQVADTKVQVTSFAEDPAGELYLLSYDGKIYRLRAAN